MRNNFLILSILILATTFCKPSQDEQEKLAIALSSKAAEDTKAKLGSQLMNAVKSNGPDGAVQFCNTTALPLTQEMSDQFQMGIKRVSDKPRNPQNQATPQELVWMAEFQKQLDSKAKIEPKLEFQDSKILAYYPIVTNANCLVCHGSPGKELNPKVHDKLKTLYPADKAIGYTADQLRGMFVVEMEKSKLSL